MKNLIYKQIDSVEIWTEQSLDAFTGLLLHHTKIRSFKNKDTPLLLGDQLLKLLDVLELWISNQYKGTEEGKFKFYLSPLSFDNDLTYFVLDAMPTTVIKLFPLDNITTSKPLICAQTEKWIQSLIDRSICLSGSSKVERFEFLQRMRAKINALKLIILSSLG